MTWNTMASVAAVYITVPFMLMAAAFVFASVMVTSVVASVMVESVVAFTRIASAMFAFKRFRF